jgi:hypothetical protein
LGECARPGNLSSPGWINNADQTTLSNWHS